MATTVRALGPEDAAAYAAVRGRMLVDTPWAYTGAPGDDPPSEVSYMREQLGSTEHAVLAATDGPGQIVAVAGINRLKRLKQRHRAYIWGVWCDPAYRGRGLGRAVVAAAIELARQWPGVEIVALAASVKSQGAIRLYESLGFIRWGLEPSVLRIDGEGIDEVHLALKL